MEEKKIHLSKGGQHIFLSTASLSREVILPLSSALVRLHAEHRVHFQAPRIQQILDVLQ